MGLIVGSLKINPHGLSWSSHMAEKSFRLRVSTAVGTPELWYEEVPGKEKEL